MRDGRIIDLDVHHTWASTQDVVEYLPARWRDYVGSVGNGGSVPIEPLLMSYPHTWGTNKRLDTFAPDGGPPGSDYETIRQQLLDRLDVAYAMLSYDIGAQSGLANPYFAAAMCRAANDWSADRWSSGLDDRFKGALLVPTELPEEGVKEIRRLGADTRFAEVLIVENPMGKPFGHPCYHPIYAAAADVGMPVAIHAGGELLGAAQPMAGGLASSRLEMFTLLFQSGMHHVASLITHGVFEKFPTLRIIFVEHGFSWVPTLLWNLDGRYRELRRESAWVKRPASEYVREHVRFTTQPIDATDDARQLTELLESFPAMEDLLCFGTDYPHWDADEPAHIAARLPRRWLDKIFYENAALLFGDRLPAVVS